MSDCDRQCNVIGGPWITVDPSCPVHGDAAQRRESDAYDEQQAVERRFEALEYRIDQLEDRVRSLESYR